jgi:hypothetical protein
MITEIGTPSSHKMTPRIMITSSSDANTLGPLSVPHSVFLEFGESFGTFEGGRS